MSREIKFRAWDGKKMRHDVTGFEGSGDGIMSGVFLDGDVYDMATTPVMQWTGRTDRNGVDIYIDDILRVVGAESGEMIVHVDDITMMPVSTLYPAGEVIGNVHQSPDLLAGGGV